MFHAKQIVINVISFVNIPPSLTLYTAFVLTVSWSFLKS